MILSVGPPSKQSQKLLVKLGKAQLGNPLFEYSIPRVHRVPEARHSLVFMVPSSV